MTWKRRGNKYGNHKVTVDGIEFDSKHEGERYLILKDMQSRGEIFNLKMQVPFQLIPSQHISTGEFYKKGKNVGREKTKVAERECIYYADFTYMKDGVLVVEDAKGIKTEAYKIKRKLMLYKYGIRIQEV